MANTDRPGFIIFHETEDMIEYMTDQQRGQLFRALLAYSRRGELIEDMDPVVMGSFYGIKASIDRYSEKYERRREINRRNGLKGGRPSAEDEEQPEQTEETQWVNSPATGCEKTPILNSSSSSNSSTSSNPNPNKNKNLNKNKNKESEEAQAYASAHSPFRGMYENVFLTDEEYNALKEMFPDADSRIDRLSEYLKVTGKGYVNHFAVIRKWAREDAKKAEDRAVDSRPEKTTGPDKRDLDAIFRLQDLKVQRTGQPRQESAPPEPEPTERSA